MLHIPILNFVFALWHKNDWRILFARSITWEISLADVFQNSVLPLVEILDAYQVGIILGFQWE